ncbi:Asp-tRNA Asn/Glu-tRNA Gln amidotransferase subunit B [Ignavibacterium album JCM 16511]|uniref:Aspartyl/glutamyl-tRNA(Asn/Gln) amidotransferase subunit B n=1 Tax=Ignavibacterium album (strain DSM 19864 / JCM 16511 / NBRC 101810 / Mat9-16) TaxID=945713 RepID=I0ALS6_IGNAJ|nr:Asp-tRNA(Asn)/Glu-tRNA(Gln) amidotransferase subunit GatB [Ignavibacterium album]AFH49933.1 Asp-tRNA Asn/Glu-tRNA Gln amidotransferase subunit B [Ignavibacterium album JCM 16511]
MQIKDSKYEAVIGLEVHAQLLTETKAFCGCSTKFGNAPNSNVCPVCLGHPGMLPVLNKKVVEFTVLMGLATNCTINKNSIFARKNYFYPDLPKGYQISQYEEPICENGFIEVNLSDGSTKKIRIKRIHMEEDAGKSIHDQSEYTLVDVNRCGVPLIEIVTEPDINSSEEAYQYLTKIKQIVQYLGICDGNMEEGSLRCDANVSVRLKGDKKLGVKTEIKNMNSFRNVERALNYEIERQIDLIEDSEKIIQQTLLWNADLNEALPMRTKEEAHDYRYFPDPDLLPVIVDDEWRNIIAATMPELPEQKFRRFVSQYNLPDYDAEILTQSKTIADYFEKVTNVTKDYKSVSNWVMTEVLGYLNEHKTEIDSFPVSAENLGKLINLISNGTISSKIAKEVYLTLLESNEDPEKIVKEKNLIQISDEGEITKIIQDVLQKNKNQIDEYLSGKDKVLGFFVGQVMKETKGKANPQLVNQILKSELEKFRK